MSTYYANDKYNAVLTAGYSVGQTTLYVSAVPNHVPTIIVAAKGTDKETVFAVTDKTTNSLTGVSRLRGANVDLDAQTPLTCLNNEEFINQSAAVDAIFYEEHDETGKHTTDQINEKTDAAGVTIDGVKHKDSGVEAKSVVITTPDADNKVSLTVNQNDVTNNPNAVNIVNTGDGIALRIDNDGDGYSLIIDSNKSVGIGTGATTPWTPFCIDMGNVTNVFGIRSVASANAAKTILTGKGNGSLIIGADASKTYIFWTNGTTIYQHVLAGTAY